MEKLRIDKWLWAARFYKTRSIAKQAIEGGKVRMSGQRVKVSKEIQVGEIITVRQGWDDRVVVVERLEDQRRGAPEAQTLYRETDESSAARETRALQRKADAATRLWPENRPNKKQRRQIHKFREDVQ